MKRTHASTRISESTLRDYIRPQWPRIQILRSNATSYGAIAYRWQRIQPKDVQVFFDREWMMANILQGHGPLCAIYEAKEGRFRSEGDSPAFLHLIDTGLRSNESPGFGGWGGRFALDRGVWKSVDKRGSTPHSILRWAKGFQNDWAARADWCVKTFDQANHPPRVMLTGGSDLQARAGNEVRVSAEPSFDPDGDSLEFRWWHYVEAGVGRRRVAIANADRAEVQILLSETAKAGEKIHIVCEVSDDRTLQLTRYRRVIVTILE